MEPESLFELNGTTLAAIGAIIGTLAGCISFVFRQLLVAKDGQIEDLKKDREDLKGDRDYWRDLSVDMLQANEKAVELVEKTTPARRRRTQPEA